jgi:hypothetical protein
MAEILDRWLNVLTVPTPITFTVDIDSTPQPISARTRERTGSAPRLRLRHRRLYRRRLYAAANSGGRDRLRRWLYQVDTGGGRLGVVPTRWRGYSLMPIIASTAPHRRSTRANCRYRLRADRRCHVSRAQNHVPTKLIRSDHASWAFSDVTFGPTIASPTGVGGSATTPNTDAANSGNAYFPQPATYVVTAYNEDTGQESRASSQ